MVISPDWGDSQGAVPETRAVHQAAVKDIYRSRMEAVLKRPARDYMRAVEVDSGCVAECYVLEA